MRWQGNRTAASRWVRGAGFVVALLVLGATALSLGLSQRPDVIRALPLSSLPTGFEHRGKALFAGTADQPAVVFFAPGGQAYAQRCGPASWPVGCTTLQLQSALAHQVAATEVADVIARAHSAADGHLTVSLSRGSTEPFLTFELSNSGPPV